MPTPSSLTVSESIELGFVPLADQPDRCLAGVGMAVNVGQCFLDNAENGEFDVGGWSLRAEIRVHPQFDFETTPFLKTNHKQFQCIRQSRFVQHRRMQQIRERPKFLVAP